MAPNTKLSFAMNSQKSSPSKHGNGGSELWIDGLLCAYEFIPGPKKHIKVGGKLDHRSGLFEGTFDADVTLKSGLGLIPTEDLVHAASRSPEGAPEGAVDSTSSYHPLQPSFFIEDREGGNSTAQQKKDASPSLNRKVEASHWVPIGWTRLAELVQSVQIDAEWASAEQLYDSDEYDLLSVADVAAPYWEPKAGPTWWCNVLAGHPYVESWLANSLKWLHPAVSEALKDESKLISERMKHLYYEVPVRVAGGLLFELLGQSVGDPHHNEEDVPIVLRSWQAQKFLVTALHVKGTVNHLNILGVEEVQDLIGAGGAEAPKSVFEVIAHLANRLARWDDRLFRKNIFGAADEVELKFVNRRANEDLDLLGIILNQEIRKLSNQVIRVKWSLHAREEILFELSQHLKGNTTHEILATIRRGTRDMIAEQEAVRDRIFTVQDAMHNTVRSVLQDKSVRITHNLTVFGGCGLILSIITGLFGINVDGIPGSSNAPYTFCIFSACLLLLGIILVGVGFLYLGLKKPISEGQLAARKLELQQLVQSFQHAAETHAKVRNTGSLSSADDQQSQNPSLDTYDYVLIV